MNTTQTNLEALQAEIDRLTAENAELRRLQARAGEEKRKAQMAADELAELAASSTKAKAKRPSKRAARPRLVEIRDIADRDRKHHGTTYPGNVEHGQNADIVIGQSIRLFGVDNNHRREPTRYDRLFAIGDTASHDSYNLTYLGTITAIGAKTVTIESHHGVKRLSIYEFNWRNRHLDLERVAADNAETMMHI